MWGLWHRCRDDSVRRGTCRAYRHGMRAIDDAALVRRLADEQMALTMCPLSNRRLQVVQDVAEPPIADLSKQGYSASAVVLSMKVAAALQAVVKSVQES